MISKGGGNMESNSSNEETVADLPWAGLGTFVQWSFIVVTLWIIAGLIGSAVLGFKSGIDSSPSIFGNYNIAHETHPYVWAAIGSGFTVLVMGSFMLAVLAYIDRQLSRK